MSNMLRQALPHSCCAESSDPCSFHLTGVNWSSQYYFYSLIRYKPVQGIDLKKNDYADN